MLIPEIHTSDLTASCLRRVQLRHEGKMEGRCTTALFRGLLFHEAARLLHCGQWDVDEGEIVTQANRNVRDTLMVEGRQMTPTVARDQDEIGAEVATLVGLYRARFTQWFSQSKIVGVEVPIRCSLKVDDEPVEFASHLDLLFRDPHGLLCTWDWKTGDEDWAGGPHVNRSMQVGMYYVALARGSVLLGEEWVELGEAPMVSIVDINALKPYSRRTTGKNDAGQEHEFVKGDLRPLRAVVREVQVVNEWAILEEFATRVRMMRAGWFPTNPTDQGCRLCESAKFCPSWTQEPEYEAF